MIIFRNLVTTLRGCPERAVAINIDGVKLLQTDIQKKTDILANIETAGGNLPFSFAPSAASLLSSEEMELLLWQLHISYGQRLHPVLFSTLAKQCLNKV